VLGFTQSDPSERNSGETVQTHLRRLLSSESGSLSPFEALLLAAFTVAMIFAVRTVSGERSKGSNSISIQDKWHGLPRGPAAPFNPLSK
jgi:hypothetical protein